MSETNNDLLLNAARVWNDLTNFRYIITYGYKTKLYTVDIAFLSAEFAHLAGFQYLSDLILPRYNSSKILNKILDGKISGEYIAKGKKYETVVRPRLEALCHIKGILDGDFELYSYMPEMYPFTTRLKADYMVLSEDDEKNTFIFLIKSSDELQNSTYSCCSAFVEGDRDYSKKQMQRTVLRKEVIEISTGKSKILYDRINNDSF